MVTYKPIKDYESLYKVSENGDVISLERTWVTGKSTLRRKPETKMAKFKKTNGYYHTQLCKNGIMKQLPIHRLVAETFIPNPENLKCVNHKDGNKENNHVSNLEWCSYMDNNIHALKNGLRLLVKDVNTGKFIRK